MPKWTCPFCGQKATVGNTDGSRAEQALPYANSRSISIEVTHCRNPDCLRAAARAIFYEHSVNQYGQVESTATNRWQLIPISRARPWPEYVPKQVREDYEEACSIESTSPKASAALSRRCLQGLIRDFFQISKPRLVDEINALETKVDDDILTALHALRDIGNIGAHPERDPSIIVEIEPGEATAMIDLLELLITETYIAREGRQRRLARAETIAKAKKIAKGSS